MLWIDAKGKRLVTIEAHPVAKVVVPGPVPPDKDQYLRIGAVIQGQGGPVTAAEWEPKTRRKKT